jgi:hypothetical protein
MKEIIINFVENVKLMDIKELKKQLHDRIDRLDDKSLEEVYSMLQNYLVNNREFKLSEEHLELIDERLEDYEKNPQNVISWEESKRLLKKYL